MKCEQCNTRTFWVSIKNEKIILVCTGCKKKVEKGVDDD